MKLFRPPNKNLKIASLITLGIFLTSIKSAAKILVEEIIPIELIIRGAIKLCSISIIVVAENHRHSRIDYINRVISESEDDLIRFKFA